MTENWQILLFYQIKGDQIDVVWDAEGIKKGEARTGHE